MEEIKFALDTFYAIMSGALVCGWPLDLRC